jgi:hypothetical protein
VFLREARLVAQRASELQRVKGRAHRVRQYEIVFAYAKGGDSHRSKVGEPDPGAERGRDQQAEH